MRKRNKIKKSSVVIVSALSILLGSFATAYAANYRFELYGNSMVTNGGGQVWKTNSSSFGRIVVGSSSAPGYSTTYRFYTYDTPVTNAYVLSNTSGAITYPLYYDDYVRGSIFIGIKASKGSSKAPEGTTVSGEWAPEY